MVGHSLGGPVVVEAAQQLRGQTVAVVGVDTFFDAWTTPPFINLLTRMRADYAAASTAFARTFFRSRGDPEIVARVMSAIAETPPEIGTPALASLVPWATARSVTAFASLGVPLGAIQAEESGHADLERARASLPRLDAIVMPGPGHFLMLEERDRFNATLDALIQRLTE